MTIDGFSKSAQCTASGRLGGLEPFLLRQIGSYLAVAEEEKAMQVSSAWFSALQPCMRGVRQIGKVEQRAHARDLKELQQALSLIIQKMMPLSSTIVPFPKEARKRVTIHIQNPNVSGWQILVNVSTRKTAIMDVGSPQQAGSAVLHYALFFEGPVGACTAETESSPRVNVRTEHCSGEVSKWRFINIPHSIFVRSSPDEHEVWVHLINDALTQGIAQAEEANGAPLWYQYESS